MDPLQQHHVSPHLHCLLAQYHSLILSISCEAATAVCCTQGDILQTQSTKSDDLPTSPHLLSHCLSVQHHNLTLCVAAAEIVN